MRAWILLFGVACRAPFVPGDDTSPTCDATGDDLAEGVSGLGRTMGGVACDTLSEARANWADDAALLYVSGHDVDTSGRPASAVSMLFAPSRGDLLLSASWDDGVVTLSDEADYTRGWCGGPPEAALLTDWYTNSDPIVPALLADVDDPADVRVVVGPAAMWLDTACSTLLDEQRAAIGEALPGSGAIYFIGVFECEETDRECFWVADGADGRVVSEIRE